MKRMIAVLACSVALSASTFADTLQVPAQYPTIQAAINASAKGDTVLLAPGVYTGAENTNLRYLGKAISVVGAGGPARVEIDCMGAQGVVFDQSETQESRLIGVTLSNSWLAIQTSYSSPRLEECVLRNHSGFSGSAARIAGGSPSFERCRFENNTSHFGGAISIEKNASVSLIDCEFGSNQTTKNYDATAGALLCMNSKLTLRDCLFENNWASAACGAVAVYGGTLLAERCHFVGNAAPIYSALVASVDETAVIESCSFIGNKGDRSCDANGAIYQLSIRE